MKLYVFIIIFLLFLLVATNINEITGQAVKNQDEFSTYTKAVCEDNYCHDELFAKCNDIEQQVELPNGNSNFSEDWKDPR